MDNLTRQQRRKNMQRIRSTDTLPERLVMRALRKRGLYFSKNVKSIIGKPDIVFRRKKLAVFIDSDFWHAHPTRFIMPKTNRLYWRTKIERNKARDKYVNRALHSSGWRVLRFWEYHVKKNLDLVIDNICMELQKAIPKIVNY
jgi:DNA mismatch endonuclease (patch repair protein)